ncbi:SMI1/KNR4 family protein [Paractinoplanes toevensis]|uniref:Knr4/Smi1-like domain-containing protein n=1 Tax=Paractinoplanes toevensis TaxID=571911 RepID=A0A919W6I8_9ACTN|nr:SMI1/KNR4 family protein [Actinoplanes toevensis]GIM93063.1 hypothetical protein Ato02nite_048560 [Actinoplanes toevensis]
MVLTDSEQLTAAEAGIALWAGRLVLDAQPPVDDETLAEVAARCAGPLPAPLVDLWRTTFGGRLDYDLDAGVSFTELFYPDSDGYRDLWGWIDHECELAAEHRPDWDGRLTHLPFGGFEYLDRIYLHTAPGPEHGAVVYWQQGLPPGWELTSDDRNGLLAADLTALFDRLALEQDPWATDEADSGDAMRDAIDSLAESSDQHARSAAEKLRHIVRATVLDWRGALAAGTLAAQRRLRRLALDHAASAGDLALLDRLVTLGCDPAEEVRNGLSPIDLALLAGATGVARHLLGLRVPVTNTLRVGAHTVDLALATELLDRGAAVDLPALQRSANNPDIAVVRLLATAVPSVAELAPRFRMLAAQGEAAAGRASAQGDAAAAERETRRAEVFRELASYA